MRGQFRYWEREESSWRAFHVENLFRFHIFSSSPRFVFFSYSRPEREYEKLANHVKEL